MARPDEITVWVGERPPARIAAVCLLGRAWGQFRGQYARGSRGRSVQRRPLVRCQAQDGCTPAPAGSAETERPSEVSAVQARSSPVQGSSPSRRAGGSYSAASGARAVTDPVRRGLCARCRGLPVPRRRASSAERKEGASGGVGSRGISQPADKAGEGARALGNGARAESYPEGCPGTEREPRKGSSPIFCELGGGR